MNIMKWCCGLAFLLSLAMFGRIVPGAEAVPTPSVGTRRPVAIGDPIICLLCIDVVQQAKQAVKDPDLQKNVEDGFQNGVCALFPKDEGTKCKERVKAYAPLVFQLVSNNLNPKIFCQDISLCPDHPVPPPAENQPAVPLLQSAVLLSSLYLSLPRTASGGISCDVCLFTVHEAVEKLTSNKTEDKVISMVDEVCLTMPSAVEKWCWLFIHEVVNEAIKLAVDDLIQPLQVCESLNFCSSRGNQVSSYVRSKAAEDNHRVIGKHHALTFRPFGQK
ncbi:prosaposin-like [Babylonia areolata]|uniref:prosaposin-like n=1 Tax=Babylonia areolata TaxID=304850 RepID=UPI003FD4315C